MRRALRTAACGSTAKSRRLMACVVPLLTILSACAVGPDYVRPTQDVPASYIED